MPINAPAWLKRRPVLALGAAGAIGACGPRIEGLGPVTTAPLLEDDALVMPDGYRLKLRCWLPDQSPRAKILALHGFNDHSGAWDIPAPLLTAQGFAVYAYDQRGFGATATRGIWPGVEALVADCVAAARLIAARDPLLPLALMGESMGGAVLLAAGGAPPEARPPAQAWVLLAPAVWGRATMNGLYRGMLWAVSHTLPAMAVSGANPFTKVTDDEAVLRAMSRDPLLIRQTRMDAVAGVVDMMDAARAAAVRFDPGPTLILWAGRDDLIPGSAMRTFLDSMPPAPPAPRQVRFDAGGYHLLLRDTGRAARAEVISRFLADHLPRRAMSQ
jgi:alpha-beta hydrolase superfamily lysophospholipase